MPSSLANYLAYSQPQGTGQSVISPLAQKLMGKQRTHWAELIGDLAMVGVDNWARADREGDRASSLAEMLAGPATMEGDASIGVPDAPNPRNSQMAELLAGNPALMPFFEAKALEQQYPEFFGEEPELVEAYNPQTGQYEMQPMREGLVTKPGTAANGGNWASGGDGTFYRTGPNGELQFSQAPGGGGGGIFSIGGAAAPASGGGMQPMQAIAGLETGNMANPQNATSPKGAMGQFQVMPETAAEIAQELGDTYALNLLQSGDHLGFEQYVRDPTINAQYGEHYFNKMMERYGGNQVLAAAAYNAGPGRVDEALAAAGGDPQKFLRALPAETQAYLMGNGQKPGFVQMTGGQQAPAGGAPSFVPPVQSDSAEAYKTNMAAFEAYVSANGLYDSLNPQQKAEVDRVRRERERVLGETRFSQANTLRDEYIQATKPLAELVMGYNRLKSGAAEASGAGDLAIVYGYMKMLDPTSVVREGELALAGQTGSLPEQIVQTYNNIVQGERLAPEVRERFISAAERLALDARDRAGLVREQYSGLASNLGIDPAWVLVDLTGSSALPERQGAGAPQPGAVMDGYRFKGGDPSNPSNWEKAP